MWKKSPLQGRLHMLVIVCLAPLTLMILYLLVMVNRFSDWYDAIAENITLANEYNLNFKEDMDYTMYVIVVNMDRAGELVDTKKPYRMIGDARAAFRKLRGAADSEYARSQISAILRCLTTLENRVREIENDATVSGSYDKNMERLDFNIRVVTDLIQEQVQKYIYYETTRLETLREDIRADVVDALRLSAVLFGAILLGVGIVSRKIMTGITEPIRKLSEATKQAGSGEFEVRVQEGNDELAILNSNFNQMIEKIGNLVEDIRVEQINLRQAELKLLQAQINPHFLYNTLDSIIWLAEAGEKEQVVEMVSSLSDFFRTTLSKGRDYISLQEEEAHIRSYLKIQQFRYRDILEYDIRIPEELYQYSVLKLTLQPLVENALYHGIKNKRGIGHIRVSARKEQDSLVLSVQDDGIGMDRERLEEVRASMNREEPGLDRTRGFGLFNVNQRLHLNYGPEYGLDVESCYETGTTVTVRIPAIK